MSMQQPGPERPRPGSPGGGRGGAPTTDALVLAALERAQRHRPPRPCARLRRAGQPAVDGVSARAVAAQLDPAGPGRATLALVDARLRALALRGEVQAASRRGLPVFLLLDAGRRRLRAGIAGAGLGESPQHRAWRLARAEAAAAVPRFRDGLQVAIWEAAALLADEPPARSDDWLELGERLRREARRLGSALHCLREWQEPGDERADVDTRRDPADAALAPARRRRLRVLRAGRRNTRLWDAEAT
jgi:hypothetical protein